MYARAVTKPRKGNKLFDSWAEVIRTVAACCAASGTVYLVGSKLHWW
jgi:uncharacterized PurR-regulated membrane protein YhhQ (DUF165 family)